VLILLFGYEVAGLVVWGIPDAE
ncbi:hypothetical protein A2U01_0075091, partial [Trifolium medium]|nr:hypothetical protein [Trifolium medium]